MTVPFYDDVQNRRDWMIDLRRDLHKHPELAFHEERTATIVAKKLASLGLEVQTGIGKTGVIAILEGAQDGPTLLVRADMDALPIHEENTIDYASQANGVMHACGHDAHTTIGLTVAEILSQQRENMAGRVKFVFQPAEEIGEGALAMIQDGALENPRPDYSIGLHVWNSLPVGKVAVTAGPAMAASDILRITLNGSGGHGAQPDQTRDPIVAAAQIVTALQTITSRNVAPLDTAVVTIGAIHAGDAFNVIPSHLEMQGTIRTFKKETTQHVHERIHSVVNGIATAMGCEASVEITPMTIAVDNDPEIAERIAHIAEDFVGAENVARDVRTTGSEDMSYFMDDIPGCYFFVGSRNDEQDLRYPHHHPKFDIDEEAMIIGATLLAQAAASFVIHK